MSTTSESRPDPARRRRALEMGLETLLTPMQVKAALNIWDEHYAPARSMALAEYVAEISQRLDYSMQERHALRVALYHSISMHDVRQGAGPAAPPAAPTIKPATTPAPVTTPAPAVAPVAPRPLPPKRVFQPAYVVFARMAGEILAQVTRDGSMATDDFCAALDRHTDAMRLNVEQVVCMRRWGNGAGTLEAICDLPEAQFGRLIHAVYAASAEALGPSAADRALARAAALAEALPEALKFPPRRLL